MRKFIIYSISLFCLTLSASANCDFERLGLGTGQEMVRSIYATEILQDPDNSYFSTSSSKGVNGDIVCSNEKYKNLKFDFLFIDKTLSVISVIDEENKINHLENLNSFYGTPTSANQNRLAKGTDDYSWQFKDKNIFLQIVKKNEFKRTNIKIISNNYTKLLEEKRDTNEVQH